MIPAHIIILLPLYCFLLATGTSELDKIHPLAHPSGWWNVTQDLSKKIILEYSIFLNLLTQFDVLKYLLLWVEVGVEIFFTDSTSQRILHLLSFLTPFFPAFLKIWVLVKSDCFTITLLNFLFILRKQVQKAFFFAWSSQLTYIFNSLLYRSMISPKFLWYHQSGYYLTQYSITWLFSIFQQLLDPLLYPFFNIYYGQKEKNKFYLISEVLSKYHLNLFTNFSQSIFINSKHLKSNYYKCQKIQLNIWLWDGNK